MLCRLCRSQHHQHHHLFTAVIVCVVVVNDDIATTDHGDDALNARYLVDRLQEKEKLPVSK